MKKIGQVRILEATLALIVVTLSIVFVNSYYKSIIGSEANQDLSDIAYEILYSLNERELLAPYIYNENSKMLEATIASALSNRYAFKLTVYKIEEEEFKEQYTIIRGSFDETKSGGACLYLSGYHRIQVLEKEGLVIYVIEKGIKHEGGRVVCLSISGG